MTRHSALITLVLATMVSGCVGQPVPSRPIFSKPGASSAQIEADEARCVVQAIGGGPEFKPVVHFRYISVAHKASVAAGGFEAGLCGDWRKEGELAPGAGRVLW